MDDDGKGRRGGLARAAKLSNTERSDIARADAEARWKKSDQEPEHQEPEALEVSASMPIARWRGTLNIVGLEVPCYVLENGQKVIGRTSATEVLTGIKGGGALEKYIGVKALEPFINIDLVLERLVPFRLLEVEGLEKAVKGLPHDLMIEICQGFVAALQASFDPKSEHPKLTARQREMAKWRGAKTIAGYRTENSI